MKDVTPTPESTAAEKRIQEAALQCIRVLGREQEYMTAKFMTEHNLTIDEVCMIQRALPDGAMSFYPAKKTEVFEKL